MRIPLPFKNQHLVIKEYKDGEYRLEVFQGFKRVDLRDNVLPHHLTQHIADIDAINRGTR